MRGRTTGSTPLHAPALDHVAGGAVRALLERGADVHATDGARLTPRSPPPTHGAGLGGLTVEAGRTGRQR